MTLDNRQTVGSRGLGTARRVPAQVVFLRVRRVHDCLRVCNVVYRRDASSFDTSQLLLHHLHHRVSLFKLPRRVLNDSNSLLNGPSSIPTGVADSNKILDDKTSPSLSNYLVRNALLILSLFFLYHGATDALSLSLLHWALLLQPFLRRRTPNRLALLPFPKTPHRQASLPFPYPATYLLTSPYMLLMSLSLIHI